MANGLTPPFPFPTLYLNGQPGGWPAGWPVGKKCQFGQVLIIAGAP